MHFAVLFLVASSAVQGAIAHYGSQDSNETRSFERVIPTQGQVWPQPKAIRTSPSVLIIDPTDFEFILKTSDGQCDLATEAMRRHRQSLFSGCVSQKGPGVPLRTTKMNPSPTVAALHELDVLLVGPCETLPHMDMTESYDLTLSLDSPAALRSKSVWGIMRGLETFSQLVYPFNETHFAVNQTGINDAPRFSHRGLLIDTSRHFLPISSIIDTLDAMAYNKMNVLHWHIVDDPSFPFVSELYPDLSKKGAYNAETHTYSPSDVARVLEEARKRGIRVLAEFDTPGHTQSWGKGYPDLLTPCYKGTSPNGKYGPINPALESTFRFLETFFEEVVNVFPDQYLHLGGDEVGFDCWMSNPNITAFMEKMGIAGHYIKLEEYYIQRLLKIIEALRKSYIVWQEVFDNGVAVAGDTVIHVWKQPLQRTELSRVTGAGHRALLSSCWYLSDISEGSDWKKYYACDPQDFDGSPEQKALVLGGEACIWGEWVDATNLISRTWPRASAVAERLWSPATLVNPDAAAARFEEHRCRMLRRGLHAEPQNGPGFCECDHLV
ncbi:beta-hexosaminidase subunit alpha [Ixodes scapularis]|uniref:Beta-hexosaminidase n=1 Tax=Ixodes scapularis TaxID=6945 RepID=A0A4D5RN45_IXOSC|nr:beta-hexosaminidase subunit alpha [Ixodes scapularis]